MSGNRDQRYVASEQYKATCIQLEDLDSSKQSLVGSQRDSPRDNSKSSGPMKYEEQRASQRSLNSSNARGRKLHQSQESHERSAAYDSHTNVAVHDFAMDDSRTRSDVDGIAANSEKPSVETATSTIKRPDCNAAVSRAPTFAHHIIAKSAANGNFIYHQDTFALVKKRQKQKQKNGSRSNTPPQPIVSNILNFTDHQTYLSMRLLSRS